MQTTTTSLSMHPEHNNNNDNDNTSSSMSRRNVLFTAVAAASIIPQSASAVERAVGSAEIACRENGNCLELGEWDGAVGWTWGGKDRCDATDPLCGADGKLRDAPLAGEAVPRLPEGVEITNVVTIDLSIGKKTTGGETGTINLGLYGSACPASVQQMLDFCTKGILTSSKLMLEEGYGVISAPVKLTEGGGITMLYPNKRLDFGIASQSVSYAKMKRLNKAGEDFVPQTRPTSKEVDVISKEPVVRKHDVAGLLSIPSNGIGYGGSGLDSDDEAYGSSFQITAAAVPGMDNEKRRVIGQVMDEESMAVLARVASLPTKKGLKGVIPGQNAGPPLLRVTVNDISVKSVASAAAASE
uniref:PPIase cyclophilin-type domain-containing protein n=1 Tax=Ditylum brightwellii TaxID=49249 RepID=A0A6U3SUP4_9STRA